MYLQFQNKCLAAVIHRSLPVKATGNKSILSSLATEQDQFGHALKLVQLPGAVNAASANNFP
jgi:hypothetical protein